MNKEFIKKMSDQAHQALCANDFATAYERYNSVLSVDSNDDTALHFFSVLLNLQGKYKTAFDTVKKAIQRYGCNASYYTTLAGICRNLGDYRQAVESIRTACELRPRDSISLSNAAMILGDERKYENAKELFEFALELDPHNPFIHFNYSILLLSVGNFTEGWKEYEWRIPFHYGKPVPQYPEDLKGKKIQIVPEQGYGDFIMFSRYFNYLEEIGANVFVNCPKVLERLCTHQHYCSHPDFTVHVASLGAICGKIPPEPYLKAPGVKKLSSSGKIKIGVATRAVKPFNNEVKVFSSLEGLHIVPHPANLAYLSTFKRSLPHDFLDFILDESRFKVYNLQIDSNCYGAENLADRIHDFADVADFVSQMDLIITIDTALAHVAGALGKKTWLLIPYDFDWRWQNDREDSPWYPSMRIFRQRTRGDWYSVQDDVMACLTGI